MAGLLVLPLSARALEAQDAVAFKFIGDRWPSAESRTNLGAGVAFAWEVGGDASLVVSADWARWGLRKPEGMVRASYFDFDLGLLYYPADRVFVGAGLGAILTAINAGPMPPGGYPTKGQRNGWTTPVRVGLVPVRVSGAEASVEMQFWRRLPVQNQAGVVKSDRWVLAVQIWGR
jgi:hypothetical protein